MQRPPLALISANGLPQVCLSSIAGAPRRLVDTAFDWLKGSRQDGCSGLIDAACRSTKPTDHFETFAERVLKR